jgi:hypothetical protein
MSHSGEVTATTEPVDPLTTTARTSALWTRDRRATTAGLLLLITMAAFEAMSVGTANTNHGQRVAR